MAKIYAALIITGRKEYINVPLRIKEDVKIILQQYVVDGKITVEQYQNLIGEPYTS